MKPQVIKTPEEYEQALAHIETLMDAEPGSAEEKELELFVLLVEAYEEEHFPLGLPDPIEAIKFRMEQEGLTRKDLVPYIGSMSKVSEVLNRKRPLSLRMIRRLHAGLGIPAEVLLQEPGKESIAPPRYAVSEFPFSKMFKRGYFQFSGPLAMAKEYGEELLAELFSVFGEQAPQALYRRADKEVDEKALLAWLARAMQLARQENLPPYTPEDLTETFFQDLVRLSIFGNGPVLAKEFLNKYGIHLIVLPHFPKTYLDGAAFIAPTGQPAVGLTLRYDRLDNFWFTLLHELAHVRLHLHDGNVAFFDDTEKQPEGDDPKEQEANQFARNALIPPAAWEEWKDRLLTNYADDLLKTFAHRLRIHPAIVAGRVRWETGDYTHHSSLLGTGLVRKQLLKEERRLVPSEV